MTTSTRSIKTCLVSFWASSSFSSALISVALLPAVSVSLKKLSELLPLALLTTDGILVSLVLVAGARIRLSISNTQKNESLNEMKCNKLPESMHTVPNDV
jgi:hypothetical protein